MWARDAFLQPDTGQTRSVWFKVQWFAVKTSDPAQVLGALEFCEATPTNLATELAAAYGSPQSDDAWVFISPALCGWVLVVGSLPYPTIETHHDIGKRFDVLFSCLKNRFEDVSVLRQPPRGGLRNLGAHPERRTNANLWLVRSDGAVLANIGEQTIEEAKLRLANLSGLSPSGATDKIFAIECPYKA